MLVYAAASARARVPDQGHPRQGAAARRGPVAAWPRSSSASTSSRASDAYFSALPDGRHRAAGRARPAQPAAAPHPRAVGQLLRAPRHRAAALARHQRRRARCSTPSPRRSAICCRSRSRSSATPACCSTTMRGLALVCLTGAPARRVSAGAARASAFARRRGAARKRSSSCRTSAPRRSRATASSRRSGAEEREAAEVRGGVAAAVSHEHDA